MDGDPRWHRYGLRWVALVPLIGHERVFERKSKRIEENSKKFLRKMKWVSLASFGYIKNERKKKMKRSFKEELVPK